jgi:hypothetical protein
MILMAPRSTTVELTTTTLPARPAEKAGAAGTIAILAGYAFGIKDPGVLAAIGAGIGLVPATVTYVVTNGGLRGVARKLWRGRA